MAVGGGAASAVPVPPAASAALPLARRDRTPFALPVLLDIALIGAAMTLATLVRSLPPLDPLFQGLGWREGQNFLLWGLRQTGFVLYQAVTLPLLLYVLGQYQLVRRSVPEWSFPRVALAAAGAFALFLALLFSLEIVQVARSIILLDFLFLLALLSGWRSLYARQLLRRLEGGKGLHNVLVVGTSEVAQRVAVEVINEPRHGRRLVGFAADAWPAAWEWMGGTGLAGHGVWIPERQGDLEAAVRKNVVAPPRHILGRVGSAETADVARAIDALNVEEVWVGPDVSGARLADLLAVCQARGVDLHIIPEHHAELGIRPAPWNLGPFTLLDVHRRPMSRLGWLAKRILDVAVAAAALVLLSPVLLVCAVMIKMEDPRVPVFYKGTRVGLNGRHFRQWKLSTMVRDADKYREQLAQKNAREGPWFKLEEKDDPRISKVGRFLRRYSLNDMPQFINVLKGDMSLVGPRPLARDEVSRFIEFDVRYHRIFDVKPGITGLWQIGDRNDPSFEYRVKKDFEYIETWSFWKDLKIMVMTPIAMLRAEQ